MNHLLKLLDLSTEEITGILDLADQLKYERKHNIPHRHLEGQTLGMIFQKSSTRTRVSFETGMYQLGGHALFLSSKDLQIGRGEPVQDTARVLSRYLDGIMIRTFEQKEVEDLAKFGSIPVINGLTDFCHPCQVLADLMTIREKFGSFTGLKMCYIGDGNNMANSLIVGGLKVGMNVAVATPDGYKPDGEVLEFTKGYADKFALETDPFMAASGADIVITDTWTSMGEEAEKEERKYLRIIRSTNSSSQPQTRALWSSTVSRHTADRRSPRKSSRNMPTRSSTRRRTVFMHRRLLWSS